MRGADRHRGAPGPRARKKGRICAVLFVLALLAAALCAVQAFQILAEDHAEAACTHRLRSYVRPVVEMSGEPPGSGFVPDAFTESGPDAAPEVDFEGLAREAPDVRGWIRIPGTEVDYPVVQASDNAYYLTHSADGSENRAGSVFIDAWNAPDFADPNTVLYGHRMNNGTMFASLHRLTDQELLESFHQIHIAAASGGTLTYEVFCTEFVPADAAGAPYRMHFGDESEFSQWLSRPRGDVRSQLPARLLAQDKILTLSTCIRGDSSRRLIVQAYLTEIDGVPVRPDEGEGEAASSLSSFH